MRPARLECGLCEQTFASRIRLREHMLNHKETTKKWECERCHWEFTDQLSLERHMIQSGHNAPQDVECGSCHKLFTALTELDKHRRFPSPCSDAFLPTAKKFLPAGVANTPAILSPMALPKEASVAAPTSLIAAAAAAHAARVNKKPMNFDPPQASLPEAATTALGPVSANVDANKGVERRAHGHYPIEQLQSLRTSSLIEPTMAIAVRPDDGPVSPALQSHVEKIGSKALLIAGVKDEDEAENLLAEQDKPQVEKIEKIKHFYVAHFTAPAELQAALGRIDSAVRDNPDPQTPSVKIYREPKPRDGGARNCFSTTSVQKRSPAAPTPVFQMSKPPSTSGTDDGIRCETCKKSFASLAAYNRHFLFCVAVADSPSQPSVPSVPEHSVCRTNEGARPANKENAAPQFGNEVPQQVHLGRGQAHTSPQPAHSQPAREDAPRQLTDDTRHARVTAGSSRAAAAPSTHLPSLSLAHQRPSEPHQRARKPELQIPTTASQHPAPVACPSNTTAASTASTATVGACETASVTDFKCSAPGCTRSFKSEPGLKTHLADVHGIGGAQLDIVGRDSWMLNRRTRELIKQELLSQGTREALNQRVSNPTPSVNRTRSRNAQPVRSPPPRSSQPGMPPRSTGNRLTAPSMLVARVAPVPPPIPSFNFQLPAVCVPAAVAQPSPIAQVITGEDEMIQAQNIGPLIIRLKLQDDIELHDDGKIICTGIVWKRMSISSQAQITSTFEPLCHLPKKLQADFHVPGPVAFQQEHAQRIYPEDDFLNSPGPLPPRAALNVVAISCIKIDMADGLHEVAKVAAIDVATCRILMNNIVCTDPKARVNDWHTKVTGLAGFNEIEDARKAGYKVFRGWKAVRSALFKFIDRDTILVGHDIRADLDALRMIHGRAIDVAKIVEKAADGPLSMKQLSLETLSRDFPKIQLLTHRQFGRDALQNAFAVRELALWCIKNKEDLGKRAKQMSLDYQRLVPAK